MWSSGDEGSDDNSDDDIGSIPRRRRQNTSKDEHLYGVFADEIDSGSKRSRNENDFDGNKKSRVVSFVSVSNTSASTEENSNSNRNKMQEHNKEEEEDDDDDDEVDDDEASEVLDMDEEESLFRKTMGFALGGSSKKEKYQNDLNQSSGKPQRQQQQPKSSKSVEKPNWEKHTKGFGMKMLLKHGYQGGGLGKEGKGISRHVEVAGPRGREGLGSVQESTNLKVNKLIQKQLSGKNIQNIDSDDDDDDENKNKKHHLRNIAEQTAKTNLWQKNKKHSQKKNKNYSIQQNMFTSVEKEKEIVGEEYIQKKKFNSLVVDMRKAETKIISSFDGTSSLSFENEKENENENNKLFGVELLHNLNLHVNISENISYEMEQDLNIQKMMVENLNSDFKHLTEKVSNGEKQLMKFNKIEKFLNQINKISSSFQKKNGRTIIDNDNDNDNDNDKLFIKELLNIFKILKSDEYKEEYSLFNLGNLMHNLISPLLDIQLNDWDVLNDPFLGVDLLEEWKPFLLNKSNHHHHHSLLFDSLSDSSLLSPHILIMRKIRQFLTNEIWHIETQYKKCIRLLESLVVSNDLIPSESVNDLLLNVILPKIKLYIEDWCSSKHLLISFNSRVDQWFSPFLSFLSNDLELCFPMIRKKLINLIFIPSSSSSSSSKEKQEKEKEELNETIDILKSWIVIFDSIHSKHSEQFYLQIGIKLTSYIQNDLVIDPSNQQLTMINSILNYTLLLPSIHIRCLFGGEFFPKWFSVLYEWLINSNIQDESTSSSSSSNGDINAFNKDIVLWYSGWKSFLNNFHPIIEQEIRGYLSFALDLMNVCRDRQANKLTLPPSNHSLFTQFSGYLSLLKMESKSSSTQNLPSSSSSSSSTSFVKQHRQHQSSTFKEVVTEFAEMKGIEFYIKNGRQYQGRQLYAFGSFNVYLESDVVHVDQKHNGLFVPIGLEELILLSSSSSS